MTESLSLNGIWDLCCFPQGRYSLSGPDELGSATVAERLTAAVPGNFELDLHRAGKIPDPYIGENARALRPYEFYEWWLERDFSFTPTVENQAPGARQELVFAGIDCIATVWLNGHKLGDTANAFIEHFFDVTDFLRPGVNRISVRIASANLAAREFPVTAAVFSHCAFTYEALRLRKPAHVWGWDIAPRMALGGLWRAVELRSLPAIRFTETYLQTGPETTAEQAELLLNFNFTTTDNELDAYKLRIEGECGESRFAIERPVWTTGGAFKFTVEQPQLWWPRNYGAPSLYHIKLSLFRGTQLLACEIKKYGIRTVELQRRPLATSSPDPDFQFVINHVPVRVIGSNWVPADALHSRDNERLPEILARAADLNCNLLRVWGGGVYEAPAFYDFCDREGIMVWQDFMMGCALYPQDADFSQSIAIEAATVIKLLRWHPSLILWAGDNECDEASIWAGMGGDPETNILTRKIIPEQLHLHDPMRPYLPSSPWISPEARSIAAEQNRPANFAVPEQHLWGPRDYFKSDFYRHHSASFVSEIGYHGCPEAASIAQFTAPEYRWPWHNNPEWDYHASNPFSAVDSTLSYRTELMAKQIREMFGTIPDNLDDFVIASQICQAEAKKYFIEMARSNRKMSGIVWWNLQDCWPQFSDAVVDYYGRRKLAYYYIRRLQQPLLIMLAEPAAWKLPIVIINDSRQTLHGNYTVKDADLGTVIFAAEFTAAAGKIHSPAAIENCSGEQKLFLIDWTLSDGTQGRNHYLCGVPTFSLPQYRRWLDYIGINEK